MATAVCVTQSDSIVERLIRPAILKLIGETDGSYRCERDLHHHFTMCLGQVTTLELGTNRRRVYMEHPALACYGTGRKGNLDYFFPETSPGSNGTRAGVAVELNFNYRDGHKKIVQDIQKLIDPDAAYSESVYFAYGKKRRFFEEVVAGIDRAFGYFAENNTNFRLPPGLHVIVVEHLRDGGHKLRETCVISGCTPSELQWTETMVEQTTDATVAVGAVDRSVASSLVTKLGASETKLWIHWTSSNGQKYFLAFVNQFDSCSLRKFEASTGRFIGPIQYEDGDFQTSFKTYLTSGQRLTLSRQPNLQRQCRPKLPDWVLAELRRQVLRRMLVSQ